MMMDMIYLCLYIQFMKEPNIWIGEGVLEQIKQKSPPMPNINEFWTVELQKAYEDLFKTYEKSDKIYQQSFKTTK